MCAIQWEPMGPQSAEATPQVLPESSGPLVIVSHKSQDQVIFQELGTIVSHKSQDRAIFQELGTFL